MSPAAIARARMSAPNELMTIERVAVLQRVALFGEVPGHTLVAVARLLEEVSFEAGDTIIERGAVEDWLFVVAEGRIRVHIGERTLLENGPGRRRRRVRRCSRPRHGRPR